eukprot:gene40863-50561_t
MPLVAAGQVVGSVAQGAAWHLQVAPEEVTPALNAVAAALHAAGRCGPWRNEQLAVTNAQGEVVGTVERGAVRVLGITTRAVHLVGLAPDGRMWVQKRSLTKPNNPGMWDTLMGEIAPVHSRRASCRAERL